MLSNSFNFTLDSDFFLTRVFDTIIQQTGFPLLKMGKTQADLIIDRI